MTSPNLPGVPPPPSAGGLLPSRIGLPENAVSVFSVDQDLGRGPGGPGGGRAPRGGVAPVPRGTIGGQASGGGYTQEDLAAILSSMPAEQLARIQTQMQVAGLIGPQTKYTKGQPDKATFAAFEELLGIANIRASSWQNILDGLQNPGALAAVRNEEADRRLSTELSFGTKLNTYERSDPAGVRQTAEAAFKQALGRKPKKDELERFVTGFLGRERASQQTVFDVQDRLAGADRDRAMMAASASGSTSGSGGGFGGEGGSEADILWQRLQKMVADSPYEIGLGKRSRSYEEQVRLWNEYQAGRGPLAAKPGTSKHGNGRANDLKYSSPAARKWALENAHKYGLHFPLYDPSKPRSKDESWHVEVKGGVGAGHAPGDGHDHGEAAAPAPGGVPVAPISEDVTVQRQDLAAQAVEYARNVNPDETQAYDIGQQFNNMLAILSRGVV